MKEKNEHSKTKDSDEKTEQQHDIIDYEAEYRRQTGKDLATGEYVTQ